MIKVSDYIVQSLHRRGVRHVFELSGGMITHLLNSLYDFGQIRVVSVHHEQAAAFAADATGRLSGIPGIALATSGPGAVNLLTGIGSCYFDSSPAVFLTGQVNRHELRGTKPIRQLGFQETDIVSMAAPITKAAWQVKSADEVPELLDRAFCLATTGRPGPVLLDIPMDIQNSLLEVDEDDASPPTSSTQSALDPAIWPQLSALLQAARRPLILAGAGIRASGALDPFHRFVRSLAIPVVHSLLAVDVLAATDPLRVGMIGSYANRWANHAIANCDLLLVLGSRLDIRQTGNDTKYFKGDRTIVHVDCEAGEINHRVTGCFPVVSELKPFLLAALQELKNAGGSGWDAWRMEIQQLRTRFDDCMELAGCTGINPNHFMHQLAAASQQAAAYIVDVGQHQMWAAQSLDLTESQRFITSGGMGSMGFSLPASIGAAFQLAPRPVVAIAGDGSFQCNLQELQTVLRNHLPVKLVVLNNRCHGMVRQFQQSYFQGHYQSTYWGYSCPDFVQVAQAYGISAARIETPEQVDAGIAALWKDPQLPFLLEVSIDPMTNVYPKIAFGRPLTEMEPDVAPTMMEST